MLDKFSTTFKDSLQVLVINDIYYARGIIIKMLKNLGITNVTEASDGKEGLELIKSNQFNIVLCDWDLPELSGISLLQIIRLSHETTTLPFIMVTSNQRRYDIENCIVSGVSALLLKPFTVEGLAKELNALHDNILLHRSTSSLLTDEIMKALDSQMQPDK